MRHIKRAASSFPLTLPATLPRRGFTLVELLAVIAIIGTLVSLLLPAVQAAREAMRRSSCANNIRQIAMAVHNYHDAQRVFPYGQIVPLDSFAYLDGTYGTSSGTPYKTDRRCWMLAITPFIELTDVHDLVMKGVTLNNAWPFMTTAGSRKYSTFMCASDPYAGKISMWAGSSSRGFCGNYLACGSSGSFGPSGGGTNLDGISYCLSKTKASDVTDGLSKTALLAECIVVPDPPTSGDMRGGYFNASYGNTMFSTWNPPNTTVGDGLRYIANWPPLAPTGSTAFVQYTRSMHRDGVNVAMADGAVRFVTNSVNAAVWTAAGSRNGGENLGAPE